MTTTHAAHYRVCDCLANSAACCDPACCSPSPLDARTPWCCHPAHYGERCMQAPITKPGQVRKCIWCGRPM